MLKNENAYRTITEVADLLQVPATVLRFWETQFHQIKPVKRMNRRYYQAEDVVLLARIRDYLYKEGFTIRGVQKRLKETKGHNDVVDLKMQTADISKHPEEIISSLTDLKNYLEKYI